VIERPGRAPSPSATLTTHVLEGLWLVAAFLVPVVFASPDVMIDLYQVSKVTLLRLLVGLMAMVWVVEWALVSSPVRVPDLGSAWPRLRSSLRAEPAHWIVLGAAGFLAANVLSTLYSASFSISLWGKVPALDGYPLYTTASYVLLFAVIATHLRTSAQVWRLLAAVAAAGVVAGTFGVLQNAGLDPFADPVRGRVIATLGNAVFAGAFLALTIPVTLGLAIAKGRRAGPWLIPLASVAVAVQAWALVLTLSRGPWMGLGVALLLFAMLGTAMVGRTGRIVLAGLVVGGLLLTGTAALVLSSCDESPKSTLCSNRILGRVATFAELAPSGTTFVLEWLVVEDRSGEEGASSTATAVLEKQARVPVDPGNERLAIWAQTLDVIAERPGLGGERDPLDFLLPVVGYGPELFRYAFPAGNSRELENTEGSASYAHNHLLHTWLELGVLGLAAHAALLITVFAGGGLLLIRRTEQTAALRWALAAILAALGGWAFQGMFGIARIGDLMLFWALAALVVALPHVSVPWGAAGGPPPARQSRHRARSPRGSLVGARLAVGLVAFVLVAGLTWTKNINYAVAEMRAHASTESFERGAFPRMVEEIDEAINLAPDAAKYHRYKAQIYAGAKVAPGSSIDPLTFLEERYLASRAAVEVNPLSVASQSGLADSAWVLFKAGQQDKLPEAIRHYKAVTTLMANNHEAHNRLAEAYLNSAQFEEALAALADSLDITWGSDGVVRARQESGEAFYLKGLTHRELGERQEAVVALRQSLYLRLPSELETHAKEVLAELIDG
jgi:O-antigen ligase